MLQPGDVLGDDFELIQPLSRGGMGAVYLARQRSTDAIRVVKVMLPGLVQSSALRERFEREARASGRINSEHVVKMIAYGVDRERGIPWLAMEYLPGATLEQRVLERGVPTPELCFELLRQLFHGVASAHAAGIVHRDLKPSNIYVAEAQRADVPFTVKVLDFGIAKVLERNPGITSAMGTRAWMAPEQERPDVVILPAADVWALGLITFWLLSGRPFWRHVEDADSLLSYEVNFAAIPPASARARELRSGPVLAGFDAWFEHAVSRDPASRFRDARAAWEALAPLLLAAAWARPTGAPPPVGYAAVRGSTMEPAVSQRSAAVEGGRGRRGSWVAAFGAAGALLALGSAVTRVLTPRGEVEAPIASLSAAVTSVSMMALAAPSASSPPAFPPPPAGMVFVPAGIFRMGKGAAPPHGPERDVRLTHAFFIDRFEVSVADYAACVAKRACSPSGVHGPRVQAPEVETFSHFCTGLEPGRERHPINCVDRAQAAAYCRFVGKRLPTEAEWERAARGSDGRRYPWGNDRPASCDQAVVSGLCPATGPRAIGLRAPSSSSPFGVFDMAGNVWEWVQDGYEPQLASIATGDDPFVPGVIGRGVLRGGSWDFAPTHAEAAHRLPMDPAEGHVASGVRCAADVPPLPSANRAQ